MIKSRKPLVVEVGHVRYVYVCGKSLNQMKVNAQAKLNTQQKSHSAPPTYRRTHIPVSLSRFYRKHIVEKLPLPPLFLLPFVFLSAAIISSGVIPGVEQRE